MVGKSAILSLKSLGHKIELGNKAAEVFSNKLGYHFVRMLQLDEQRQYCLFAITAAKARQAAAHQ